MRDMCVTIIRMDDNRFVSVSCAGLADTIIRMIVIHIIVSAICACICETVTCRNDVYDKHTNEIQ